MDPASGYALALLLVRGVPPLNPQKFDCGSLAECSLPCAQDDT